MLEVKEYSSAAEMLEAYKARFTPRPPVVVRKVEPEPEPEPVSEQVSQHQGVVADMLRTSPKSIARLTRIVELVADTAGVSVDDIKSGGRKKKLVQARGVYCYMASKFSFMSGVRISSFINKDHTSGRYHVQMVTNHPEDYEPILSMVWARLKSP